MFRLLTIKMGKLFGRNEDRVNGKGVSAMTRLFRMFEDENRITDAHRGMRNYCF
ncbi:hypothetical protein ATG70_0536 [Bacillus sp. es.036]|nr:hypothetical protein ATG70_0536 [Bacillus sp. es.036]